MTSRELTRSLKGRTIVKVELRPFSNGRGGNAYDPKITLDDGSYLVFGVEETESLKYGVEPFHFQVRQEPV